MYSFPYILTRQLLKLCGEFNSLINEAESRSIAEHNSTQGIWLADCLDLVQVLSSTRADVFRFACFLYFFFLSYRWKWISKGKKGLYRIEIYSSWRFCYHDILSKNMCPHTNEFPPLTTLGPASSLKGVGTPQSRTGAEELSQCVTAHEEKRLKLWMHLKLTYQCTL